MQSCSTALLCSVLLNRLGDSSWFLPTWILILCCSTSCIFPLLPVANNQTLMTVIIYWRAKVFMFLLKTLRFTLGAVKIELFDAFNQIKYITCQFDNQINCMHIWRWIRKITRTNKKEKSNTLHSCVRENHSTDVIKSGFGSQYIGFYFHITECLLVCLFIYLFICNLMI